MLNQLRQDTRDALHEIRLKRAAQGREPSLGAPLTYRNAIDLRRISLPEAVAGAEGVFVPDEQWRGFRRLGPAFFDNPGGDERFAFGDLDGVYPPSFLVSAPGALLTGYRTVITRSGHVVNDDCALPNDIASFIQKIGDKDDTFVSEGTGLVADADGDALRLSSPRLPAVRLRGSTVLLSSHEPRNYGSLLFRVLPKLYSVQRWGLDGCRFLVPKLGRATDELLGLLGVRRDRVIEHTSAYRYRADHLLVPSLRNNQAFLDPESIGLIGSLRERFGRMREKNKRIYISRHRVSQSTTGYRKLMNEERLIAILRDKGFEIFCPEEHSIKEQIETMSSASMVVGPSGAGMFNAIFCWPGTKLIDLESEPWWLHAHMCLFSSCRLQYGIIVGRADPTDDSTYHKRWEVDVELVGRRVAEFEAS